MQPKYARKAMLDTMKPGVPEPDVQLNWIGCLVTAVCGVVLAPIPLLLVIWGWRAVWSALQQ